MISTDFELLQPQGENLLLDRSEGDIYDLNFSAVGDIFNNHVFLGSGTIYRSWHFEIPSPNLGRRELSAKVSIRLNPISSLFVLIVNGEPRLKCKTNFEENVMKIVFKLYDNDCELLISVIFPKLYYNFELKLNNLLILDLKQLKAFHLSLRDPTRQPKNVKIPSLRTTTINKKTVVVYQIFCEVNKLEKIMVEKRFSDFVKLDTILHGLFTSTHLKDTLPVLPNKIYNPFFNQNSFQFISQRKSKLEDYLNFLLSNEKISTVTEVLCFLGIDPISYTPLDQLPIEEGKTGDIRSFPSQK